jgi:hypothetical protein
MAEKNVTQCILTVTQNILIPERRAAYSTVSIEATMNNRLRWKYAFHMSVPAF